MRSIAQVQHAEFLWRQPALGREVDKPYSAWQGVLTVDLVQWLPACLG